MSVESKSVRQIVQAVVTRLEANDIFTLEAQAEAIRSAKENRRRGVPVGFRETWRKIRDEGVEPSQLTIDRLVAYLQTPTPSGSRDDGIRYAIERMEEVLDSLREMVTAGPNSPSGDPHAEDAVLADAEGPGPGTAKRRRGEA